MLILVAIDDSPHARRAVQQACLFARAMQAELVLLYVTEDTNLVWYEALLPAESGLPEESRRLLKQALSWVSQEGLQARGMHRVGAPAVQILTAAAELKADLIVIASHGRSATQRFLLGSVTSQVMSHAQTSVLVIRP